MSGQATKSLYTVASPDLEPCLAHVNFQAVTILSEQPKALSALWCNAKQRYAYLVPRRLLLGT